jgi:HK97 family phage major capsid protein
LSTETAKREFEAYRKDEAEARAILDGYAEKNEDLSTEDQQRFDALVESGMVHKKRADQLVEMTSGDSELEQRMRAIVGDSQPDSDGSGDEHRGFTARLIDAIGETKRQHDAGNSKFEMSVEGLVDLEKRAIADFSDAGALYTTDFSTQVAVYQRTVSPWINLASVINADNGRPLNLPNLTADPTAVSPGEGTAITENSGAIGSAALTTTAYKTLSYVSMEAEEDELVGLLPIIAKAQGRSIGLKFGSDLTVAMVAAATNGGTAQGVGGNGTAASTFFGYEDLIDLKYGAAVPYRQAGSWIMSNGAIKKVRKFKDQNGAYFWVPSIGPGMPDMFDGNPAFEDPYLAAPASVTKSVLFGDVSAVVIKQMPLRVATSSEFRFSNDQVALKTVYRAGGALPDATALRYLISANT